MGLITEKLVMLELDCSTKKEVIERMAKAISDEGFVEDYEEFLTALYKREDIAPTAVGYDVGLPHGTSKTVKKPGIAFARLKTPIMWNVEEKEIAKMVFMLAIPDEGKGTDKISILIDLSKKILDDSFREKVMKISKASEIVRLINE